MPIADVDRTLPSNRMIFEVRRDVGLFQRFIQDIDGYMEKYALTDAEKEAWRNQDIAALAKLGVHPYFLPQVSRMFNGSAYNHNNSAAAQAYAKNMVDPA